MGPDSHLQNEVAGLERRVLEAKKAALQKQFQTLTAGNPAPPTERPVSNQVKARNSNFGLFYGHGGEESHLVSLMRGLSVGRHPIHPRHQKKKISSSRKTS